MPYLTSFEAVLDFKFWPTAEMFLEISEGNFYPENKCEIFYTNLRKVWTGPEH